MLRLTLTVFAIAVAWPIAALSQDRETPATTFLLEARDGCGGSDAMLTLGVELGRRLPDADIRFDARPAPYESAWLLLWRSIDGPTCELWLVRSGDAHVVQGLATDNEDALRDAAVQIAWIVDAASDVPPDAVAAVAPPTPERSDAGASPSVETPADPEPSPAEPIRPTEVDAEPEPQVAQLEAPFPTTATVETSALPSSTTSPYDAERAPRALSSIALTSDAAFMNGQGANVTGLRIGVLRVGRWELDAQIGRVFTPLDSKWVYAYTDFNGVSISHRPELGFTFGSTGATYRIPLSARSALSTRVGLGAGSVRSSGYEDPFYGELFPERSVVVGVVEGGGAFEVLTGPVRWSFGGGYRFVSGDGIVGPEPLAMSGPHAGLTLGWAR